MVAAMFHDGDVVNLGVGIPTLASTYVPEGMTVLFHAENGCVGAGEAGGFPWDFSTRESVIAWLDSCAGEKGSWKTVHKDLCNASGEVITLIPGACCFDSTMAFAIARGGHLDATVLGALQVDEDCNLANWKIPGKKLNGMGGAMDIVSGAKKVIIAMEHCTKNGDAKIVEHCSLPLTRPGLCEYDRDGAVHHRLQARLPDGYGDCARRDARRDPRQDRCAPVLCRAAGDHAQRVISRQ